MAKHWAWPESDEAKAARIASTLTVVLGERVVNISKLAREHNLDRCYLSHIFSGRRTPSIAYGQRIAAALEIDLLELLRLIQQRKAELEAPADPE